MNFQIKHKQLITIDRISLLMPVVFIVGLTIYSAELLAQQAPTLTIDAYSDSQNTTGMHYMIRSFSDASCEKPKKKDKLFRKKYAKPEENFKAIELTVDKPFFFQVEYSEKRRLEERFCNYMIGFVPEDGRSYRAQYNVKGQVSGCSIDIIDAQTEEPVETELIRPERWCKKNSSNGSSNGVAEHKILRRF